MLTEKDLDEFADYMRSGAMETDFRDGCEHDRHYLLNLLEKLMDVADLADETATKLIFRGGLGALFPNAAEKSGDAATTTEAKAASSGTQEHGA